jgi:hypothetical protein
MRTAAQIISWIALLGTLVPSLAYLAGSLSLDAVKTWMLGCTLGWFLTVPVWMDRADQN